MMKNMAITMFRYKKCICDTKKEPKTRHFQPYKKHHSTVEAIFGIAGH
jgi:hypothetical protein